MSSKLKGLKAGAIVYLKATPSIRTWQHGTQAEFAGLCTYPPVNRSAFVILDGQRICVARSTISVDPV